MRKEMLPELSEGHLTNCLICGVLSISQMGIKFSIRSSMICKTGIPASFSSFFQIFVSIFISKRESLQTFYFILHKPNYFV
jgi:hypothetical protein